MKYPDGKKVEANAEIRKEGKGGGSKHFIKNPDGSETQVFTTAQLGKRRKVFEDGTEVPLNASICTEGKGCAIKHFLKNSDGSKTPVFTMSSRDAKLKKGDNREHLQETAAKKRKHVEITDNLSDSKTPQKKKDTTVKKRRINPDSSKSNLSEKTPALSLFFKKQTKTAETAAPAIEISPKDKESIFQQQPVFLKSKIKQSLPRYPKNVFTHVHYQKAGDGANLFLHFGAGRVLKPDTTRNEHTVDNGVFDAHEIETAMEIEEENINSPVAGICENSHSTNSGQLFFKEAEIASKIQETPKEVIPEPIPSWRKDRLKVHVLTDDENDFLNSILC